ILGIEIDVDDVLVFLGRILRIGDRTVGTPGKPARMLLEPRMIRGALNGKVEGDLEPMHRRRLAQLVEILERAKLRMNRVMPALFRANRIRAAGLTRLGLGAVVATLAVDAADRMDRWEIKHVESHRGDRRQPRDHVLERAVPGGGATLRARE